MAKKKFSFKKFFPKKIDSKIIIALLILIPFIFAWGMRVVPAYLPITDEWAEDTVMGNLRNTVTQEVYSNYPTLTNERKNQIVAETFAKQQVDKAEELQAAIKEASNYYKSQLKNENNNTYLLAIDPYTYYRRAQNVLNTGMQRDTLKDGVPWSTYKVAPLGMAMGYNLHPYIIAYLHQAVGGATGDLMGTAFFIPILFSALAVIPAFFLGKRFAGNPGGFTAAMLVAIAAPLIQRTAGGFVDTDAYNVFFPLMIAWLFMEAMERKEWIHKVIFAGLSGLFVGLFSAIWEWWFIFDLLVIVLLGFFAYHFVKFLLTKKEFAKTVINNMYSGVAFVVSSGIFVSLFTSFSRFINEPIKSPLSYYSLKAVAEKTLWPNVITTVAEQNSLSVSRVISLLGGKMLFFLAIIGIFMIAFKLNKLSKKDGIVFGIGACWLFVLSLIWQPENAMLFLSLIAIPFVIRYVQALIDKREFNIEFSFLMIAWFAFTFYVAVRGVRFSLLLYPVFALGVGVAIGKLYMLIEELLSKTLSLEKSLSKVIVSILVLLVLISPITTGYKTAYSEIPSMNDAWYKTLTKINNEASEDAIINSWWDFGHWFKSIGNRSVTFDGASQNTPMAHWIGLSLLTEDEQLTVGILRMLDCGSNTAFEELDAELNDTPVSIDLLYKIVVEDKAGAKQVMETQGVSEATITKVLENTHCEPPEDYYITSGDMVKKSGVWAHFGSWNYNRASMVFDVRRETETVGIGILQNKYNMTEEESKRVYWDIKNSDPNQWIAPWPSYTIPSDFSCYAGPNSTLQCPIPNNAPQSLRGGVVLVDLKKDEAFLALGNNYVKVYTLVYPIEGGYQRLTYPDGEKSLGVAIIPPADEKSPFKVMLMDPALTMSTFHKLFYYQAHEMDCFELFDYQKQLNGENIFVWKVNWNCTNE